MGAISSRVRSSAARRTRFDLRAEERALPAPSHEKARLPGRHPDRFLSVPGAAGVRRGRISDHGHGDPRSSRERYGDPAGLHRSGARGDRGCAGAATPWLGNRTRGHAHPSGNPCGTEPHESHGKYDEPNFERPSTTSGRGWTHAHGPGERWSSSCGRRSARFGRRRRNACSRRIRGSRGDPDDGELLSRGARNAAERLAHPDADHRSRARGRRVSPVRGPGVDR